jgi:hypothetical protein
MNIKEKIERAFAEYLRRESDLQSLTEVAVFEGKSAEERTLPCVIVYAESAEAPDEFPSASGIFEVELKIFVLTQADDEAVEDQNERVRAVLEALMNGERVPTWFNVPEAGEDERPVKDLHVYDVQEEAFTEGRDERHFGDVLAFRVICQGVDG